MWWAIGGAIWAFGMFWFWCVVRSGKIKDIPLDVPEELMDCKMYGYGFRHKSPTRVLPFKKHDKTYPPKDACASR